MNSKSIFEDHFYCDGRGPELQETIWKRRGSILVGFTYYNPDEVHDATNLRHLKLNAVEAYMMTPEESHPNVLFREESKSAMFEVIDSTWLSQFNAQHMSDCRHFQIRFYDEIYDVICREITPGIGSIEIET